MLTDTLPTITEGVESFLEHINEDHPDITPVQHAGIKQFLQHLASLQHNLNHHHTTDALPELVDIFTALNIAGLHGCVQQDLASLIGLATIHTTQIHPPHGATP